MNRVQLSAVVLAVLCAGVAGGYWWGQRAPDAPSSATPAAEKQALYWYDPMVPDQHFDKPGKSPFMEMQLVPKYADEAGSSGVGIAPGVRQNLGIRTAEVRVGSLPGGLQVPGTLTWDLRREHVVSARVDAMVDRLHVKAPYEVVRAGQSLATVLAPEWSSAIAEYQALGSAGSDAAQALRQAARERMRVLGIPPGATHGGNGRVVLRAPASGVVSEITAREGQTAPMGTALFRINGIDTLWLEAAVPQAGLAGVVAGTPVEATVSAVPGRIFEGRVDALLPQIDPGTRTQSARIVIDNADGLLAPGMFAQVSLRPTGGAEYPLVPSEAVIATGLETRVIVLDDEDRFQPVAVRTGRSGGGYTEILSGLKSGERVVASGQFLIDSEANLSGALGRLGTGEPGEGGREVLYWYDPMKPDQHFDKPGKSPFMDMQLVPKYADEASADATQAPQP